MRLWHWRLIPYLPRTQLLAQWRELNSIFKKQDRHILINYIYDYDVSDLYGYSNMVINEMTKRGYKIKSFENHNNFFEEYRFLYKETKPFKKHHTDEYLIVCYWNLKEKYIRGQKDFDLETWDKLNDFISNELSRMLDEEVERL